MERERWEEQVELGKQCSDPLGVAPPGSSMARDPCAQVQVHSHAHAHTHTHARTHSTRTRTRTHTHTYTHSHMA